MEWDHRLPGYHICRRPEMPRSCSQRTVKTPYRASRLSQSIVSFSLFVKIVTYVTFGSPVPGKSWRMSSFVSGTSRCLIVFSSIWQQVVAYPLSQGKLVNVAAFHARHELENTPYDGPWISSAGKQEFLTTTSQWEPEVQALLSVGVPFESRLGWAIPSGHSSAPTHSASGPFIPSSRCPPMYRDELL